MFKYKIIKSKLLQYLQNHPEVEMAYIFGSIAQDQANVLSDIDIAIMIDENKVDESKYHYGYKVDILTELIKLFQTNHVDLVIINEAPALIKHRILFYGKLIYSKNEQKSIQFQVDTLNQYMDYREIQKPHAVINA